MPLKLDSNLTELSYAKEQSLRVLPATPQWQPLEPNSYSDFGGDTTLVARDFINSTRQLKRGTIVDLSSNVGINFDFCTSGVNSVAEDLIPGFFCANWQGFKPTQNKALSGAATSGATITATIASAFTGTLPVGTWGYIKKGTEPNLTVSAFVRISAVAGTTITIDKMSQNLAPADINGSTLYVGRFITNAKTYDEYVRSTYTFERMLGNNDVTPTPDKQVEYVMGAVPNELSFTIPTADKVTIDTTFIGCDFSQQLGLKSGDRNAYNGGNLFNTSSNVGLITLNYNDPTAPSPYPNPVFSYVTDVKFNYNNNAELLKAVGTVGGFEVVMGNFEVTGELTAYFNNIDALEAIRNNGCVNMSVILCKKNVAYVFDFPDIQVSGGHVSVEKDQAIMVPLNFTAVQSKFGYCTSVSVIQDGPSGTCSEDANCWI